jgi:hypothetical protein
MDPENLRSVNYLSLNEIWDHEERDFTPWVVDHIEQLGQAIGIELDEVEREDTVGGYSADITATEMNTDSKVVIENQFGTTNHDHLGKLLTYGAGTDAEFIIWLAEDFRDEHRSVLEWLNTGAPGSAKFFAVRPQVMRLAESEELGFDFTVVIEPNDWERELQESLTTREKAYKEFFSELTEAYAEANPNWNRLKAQPQSWLSFGAGISGVRIGWSFHQGPELSTELYIDTGDKERNEEIYSELQADQESIESELGDVVWQQLPDKRACRIKVAKPIDDHVEGLSAMEKESLIEWAVQRMDALRAEMEPRLQSL